MNRPNLLFIMTDQQRWDAMGCSGGWVRTPHLDRLAQEGVRFSRCITTSPVCIPARVTLATGRYPHNTGVWENGPYTLPPTAPTWMQAIRAAGYRTSLFGKTHLHPHTGDLREREHLLHAYGLDDVDEIGGPRASARVLSHMTASWQAAGLWDAYKQDYAQRFATRPQTVRPSVLPLEHYADVYVGRQARAYLAAYDRDEPWFCWVSFGGPHEPWDTPEPYASMYDPQEMPPPRPRPKDLAPRPHGVLDDRLAATPALAPDEPARLRADYAGNITLIDDQIGAILDVLADRGELDNTVIVFTSDHGEMNGDAGLIYKSNFLDGAVRVPLIVRTSETLSSPVAGSVAESWVEWFDIGPTLVELAGGRLKHQQFARSLTPLLAEPSRTHRRTALCEHRGEAMIVADEWKLAANQSGETYLLFDRRKDPEESCNLAGAPRFRAVADRLRLQLFERILQSQVRVT